MSSLPSFPLKIRYGVGDDLLDDFYLPVLERSVRCDRLLAQASAPALAAVATGLPRLILRGGRLRLLCGVELDDSDGDDLKAAVGHALLREWSVPHDPIVRARLAAIAWMLAHQHLELRVVVSAGAARRGLVPDEAVAVDAEGHKLAWSGDADAFWTFTSWNRGDGAERIPAAPAHVHAVEQRFETLWEGRDPLSFPPLNPPEGTRWHVVELPVSARERLLALCPDTAPRRDPLEKEPETAPVRPRLDAAHHVDERLLFRFLREAPFLPDARDLGVATGGVAPWPHQLRVVRRAVESFPRGFLFADEVGLGKTVEVGLALRQLVISGRVHRALLLVPRNVLRQWQEELYEKAALHVPRWADGGWRDVFDRPLRPGGRRRRSKNPWNAFPIALASSQLARRRERRAELLRADPWDLVVVDEAHHARRRDFRPGHDRPNKLLELLAGSGGRRGLKDRAHSVYLITATPMQVHPLEVWDLLRLLGLGGRWGAHEDNFLRFFEELRRPFAKRDWDFLAGMLVDDLELGHGLETPFVRSAVERLGEDGWTKLLAFTEAPDPRRVALALEAPARRVLDEMLRRHTPLRSFVERNTRPLLRRYRMQGLIDDNIPERRPENVWIRLKDDERVLYERIESYLSDFYRRYEKEKRGLGFVMTVYRRRLTSSFYAVRKSLERRLAWLAGDEDEDTALHLGLLAEELEDESENDVADAPADGDQQRSEQAYLEDFLRELGSLGRDSKVEHLLGDLERALSERETVLIFTQYTDTMDHLREELYPIYGQRVACYSGRGGERWDGKTWIPCRKEEIKEAFRSGEIRVLLCSDSASEGLNLQTCGVLINFDMPWNPMRVEQRIGRIDRIGQTFREVWVKNYFYEDTVEAVIYERLSDRIRWFEQVLGRLQPILHKVGEVIEKTAMLRGERRVRGLEEHLTALGMELDQDDAFDLALDEIAEPSAEVSIDAALESVLTLPQLEAALVGSDAVGPLFKPHPGIDGAYQLRRGDDERAVTFSPTVFDRYPSTVELLTYGHPLFAELLASVEAPAESAEPGGLGLYSTHKPAALSLFVRLDEDGEARPVTRLEDLDAAVVSPAGGWGGIGERRAATLFSEARQRLVKSSRAIAENIRRAQERALREGARQVLRRAALVTLAMEQSPTLFEEALPYGFGPEAVEALRQRGAPFAALLDLMAGEVIEVSSDDPFFRQIEGRADDELKRKSKALVHEGKEIAARHAILSHPLEAENEPSAFLERTFFQLIEGEESADSAGELPFRYVDSAEVQPFENAVPLYEDLAEVVARFADEPAGEGMEIQADEVRNSADYTWVELSGRTVASPGTFVARVSSEAMNRRVAEGSWCVFRLAPRAPKDGQVVLVRHHGIRDPELGGSTTLRIYEATAESYDDGSWRQSVVLRPASSDPRFRPTVLEDPEEGSFRVLARLVEVLG